MILKHWLKNNQKVLKIAEKFLSLEHHYGVFWSPGGAILYKAINVLETITLDKESAHLKEQLAQKYADIVYNGQWFTPLREALDAFANSLAKTVTGDVKLKLYKGNMINAGVTSPFTLYDEQTASFGEDEDYNQADAAGFINLFGLSIKERAKLSKSWPKIETKRLIHRITQSQLSLRCVFYTFTTEFQNRHSCRRHRRRSVFPCGGFAVFSCFYLQDKHPRPLSHLR